MAVDPAHIDAVAFEHLVTAARGALAQGEQDRGAAMLADAAALWRGPALADAADAPFAAGPIARLEELRVAAAEDLTEARLALGDAGALVPGIEELVAAHPLRERLRGQLMRALYVAGRQAEALAVYEDTRRLLAGRLGVDPSPELAAIHLAILRGEAAPASPSAPAPHRSRAPASAGSPFPEPAPAPSAPAAVVRATNLPAPLTSFVGREEELKQVGKQLGETRLVTLTGPGGAGKTRLAMEAATRWPAQLPDGVWFVPLAPVRDAREIPKAVAAVLGVPEVLRLTDAVDAALALAAVCAEAGGGARYRGLHASDPDAGRTAVGHVRRGHQRGAPRPARPVGAP